MKNVLFILCICLFIDSALHADDSHLLPSNTTEKGWGKFSKPKVFTSSDLYGYIDGGAELFLEFGFEELTVQRYKNAANAEMNIEIYRMSDQIASLGIFFMKCITARKDTSFSEMHSINNYQLIFRKDRYFIILSNQSGEERYVPALIGFAKHIASLLTANDSQPICERIPKKNQVEGTLRLIRGPYALQSIYTLGDGNVLQLSKSITAVAADYNDASLGSHTLIHVDYPDSTYAIKAFQLVKDKLDPYLTLISSEEQKMVFQDFKKLFGVIRRNKNCLSIQLNLISRPD